MKNPRQQRFSCHVDSDFNGTRAFIGITNISVIASLIEKKPFPFFFFNIIFDLKAQEKCRCLQQKWNEFFMKLFL